LGRLGEPRAVEPLIQALRDPDSPVRERAARLLGDLGDARAVRSLIEALVDSGSDESERVTVRRAVAEALARLGEVQWQELAGLDDPSLRCVAECRDPRLLKPLLSALRDRHSSVRADAAEALGVLGDPRAVQPLIVAAKEDDYVVRGQAFEALGELETDEGLEFLVRDAKRGSHCAARGLARYGDLRGADAVIEVIDHCQRSEAGETYWWFRALGEIGGERAFQRLKQEVESGEPEAIWPLARTGDPRAVDVLIRRLVDHDPATIGDSGAFGVANAAGGLAKLGDSRAVKPLIDALDVLSRPPVTAENFHRAETRRKRMLLGVIRALGDLRDPRATGEVRRLMRDQPDEIEREAAWILWKLDSREETGPMVP
jgi:HEAT repeat protein